MSSDADSIVISVKDLGKIYHLYDKPADRLKQAFLWGKRKFYREFWALRGVSFDVKRGEVLGLVGRNGSGKSTLLQIVCGVLKPSTGVATVHGRVAALLELGSGFNPEFTGRENVYLNAAILGLTRRQIDERFEAIVHFAEIGKFIDQPVKTYSSGMVVRLAFAITVHVDADVLVVDEALSVGDAAFQFKCLHHLEGLLERGVTILLVSHDVQLIKSYCTRAIYLKNNLVEFDGDCETVTEMYLQEMRAEKERMLAESAAAEQANPAGLPARVHDRGEILGVRMGCGSQERVHFNGGERAWVEVAARVDSSISRPRLSFFVRDLKGYTLFGFHSRQGKNELTPSADGTLAGRFEFTCGLRQGDYSIVVRLEDRIGDTLSLPIDKRLNAVHFKVLNESHPFLGVVDLDGAFEVKTTP